MPCRVTIFLDTKAPSLLELCNKKWLQIIYVRKIFCEIYWRFIIILLTETGIRSSKTFLLMGYQRHLRSSHRKKADNVCTSPPNDLLACSCVRDCCLLLSLHVSCYIHMSIYTALFIDGRRKEAKQKKKAEKRPSRGRCSSSVFMMFSFRSLSWKKASRSAKIISRRSDRCSVRPAALLVFCFALNVRTRK